jgi:Tfp pilus assembly protein PilF
LRAPSKARSELTKAFSALKKNDFREAQDRLDRALKLYPSYAEAYNMLGNIYIQTGDKDKARSAFENAVRFDGKHAGANLSLGRLLIDQRQFAEAEVFSLNSTVASPENPDAWTVLALSQLLQDKLDDAIANAKRAHLLPHKGLAACHLIASGAYEKRGEFAAAAAELRTYLNENPAPSPKLVEHVKRLESLAR